LVQREATVKIMRKVSKKRYFHDKNVYTHERLYVPIPKQFHDKIKPLLNKKLEIEVNPKNGGLEIVCRPRENVSVPRKHPAKIEFKNQS
jgi:hypothetical protein